MRKGVEIERRKPPGGGREGGGVNQFRTRRSHHCTRTGAGHRTGPFYLTDLYFVTCDHNKNDVLCEATYIIVRKSERAQSNKAVVCIMREEPDLATLAQ